MILVGEVHGRGIAPCWLIFGDQRWPSANPARLGQRDGSELGIARNMSGKVALIKGLTGQDGAYLAQLLLDKGYVYHDVKRRSSSFNSGRIDRSYKDPHDAGAHFGLYYGALTNSTKIIRIIQATQATNETCAWVGLRLSFSPFSTKLGHIVSGECLARATHCQLGLHFCGLDNIEGAYEVVGDDGEVHLTCGFGDPAPSYTAQAEASFPGAEDLLNPATCPVDGLVPFVELAEGFGFVTSPHTGRDNPGDAAPGANCVAKVAPAIGTVDKDLAWILGQRIRARSAIIDAGRGAAISSTIAVSA